MLDKTFDPKKIDVKNYEIEEKLGIFKSNTNASKSSFCIMMPPPNVTGVLHMGHALNFTLQDIIVRYKRLNNFNVLWQPGTDHAGIATQIVVEKEINKKNQNRYSLGKENFIKKVWEWKNKSGNQIISQMRQLGVSADWSREKFTMDSDLSRTVKKVFIDLFEKKMIFKEKRLINWDVKLQTAVSDLEVENKDIDGFLYFIKYPLKKNKKSYITIATTRPETIFGDSAVAIHPDDKRFKKFHGDILLLPILNKEIPLILDDHADPEKGSGAVKITPAHDFNDFEVGKRHKLEFINIFDKFAKINSNAPNRFIDLDRFAARKLILNELKELNLLVKEEKQLMVVPYGDRSGVIIEPWLTDQWFCNAKKLSINPIKSVKNGHSKFVPKQWEKTFFNWMENIQPWCISRQLWWGHQIPVWYGPDEKIFVALSESEANEKAKIHYGNSQTLKQDQDVLDTWFSSALWTFSTLDWPDDSYELKRFYPGNVLVTGFDIIFFWVARMMMMGSYFMKKTPFKDIYIHPLIRDEKGQKMSKSKGNIIDPLDLLDKYGADTLRFTLTAILNPGRDVKLSENRVKGYKSFSNKIWNAANFLQINKSNFVTYIDYDVIKLDVNKWIIKELELTSLSVNEYMKKYLFHEVANTLYHFIWHTFCDWYIEFIKSDFTDDNKSSETRNVSGWVFGEILKLIHPTMPFLSEQIWQNLYDKNNFLMLQKFNQININKNFNESKDNIQKIIDIISSVRNVRAELQIPYKTKINITLDIKNEKDLKFIQKFDNEIIRLLKKNEINFENIKNQKNSAYVVLSEISILIPLEGIINTNKELEKLHKKKESETEKFNSLMTKIENEDFVQKAPSHVIDDFKKQAYDLKSSIEKIDQIINTIN